MLTNFDGIILLNISTVSPCFWCLYEEASIFHFVSFCDYFFEKERGKSHQENKRCKEFSIDELSQQENKQLPIVQWSLKGKKEMIKGTKQREGDGKEVSEKQKGTLRIHVITTSFPSKRVFRRSARTSNTWSISFAFCFVRFVQCSNIHFGRIKKRKRNQKKTPLFFTPYTSQILSILQESLNKRTIIFSSHGVFVFQTVFPKKKKV